MKWICHNYAWLEDRPVAINVVFLAIVFCLSVYESGYLYLHWSNHESNESQIRKFDHNFWLSASQETQSGSWKITEVHREARRSSRKFTEVHGSSPGSSRKFTEVHGSSLRSSRKFTVKLTEVYRTSPRIKDEIGICQDYKKVAHGKEPWVTVNF